MTSSVFTLLEPLHPPAAMLGAALRIARAETAAGQEPFGELEVTLFIKHSAAVKGELVAVEASGGEAVVVLKAYDFESSETREDFTLVPASAIAAARLHLTDVQSQMLQTGRGTDKPDPYLEAHERAETIAREITESESDFSSAEVELSLSLETDALPREGLGALRIDTLLDHVERALIYAVRRPVTRQIIIHGCPKVRIEPGASLDCRIDDKTLIIPVTVDDDDVDILSEEAVESQLDALFRGLMDVIPAFEVEYSWRRLRDEADERNESYAASLGREVVVEIDFAGLPPIDEDKALEMRDIVTKIFYALSESEQRNAAYGEVFDKFIFRRGDERTCRLEDRAIIMPVVMDDDWSIESIWESEVGEEIDRLIS